MIEIGVVCTSVPAILPVSPKAPRKRVVKTSTGLSSISRMMSEPSRSAKATAINRPRIVARFRVHAATSAGFLRDARHHQADLVLAGGVAPDRAHQAAVEHHQNPVGELEQLVELHRDRAGWRRPPPSGA